MTSGPHNPSNTKEEWLFQGIGIKDSKIALHKVILAIYKEKHFSIHHSQDHTQINMLSLDHHSWPQIFHTHVRC